jgi:hypothetical protein
MDSKTAKAFDKALLKFEAEVAKLKLVVADVRAAIKKHYVAKPKAKNGPN